jgi:hypothetical protein
MAENKKEYLEDFNLLLSKMFRKEFDWFKSIKIYSLTVNKLGGRTYLGIDTDIFIDADWAYKSFREYHYSSYFPDLNNEFLSFGDIIGGTLSIKIQNIVKDAYQLITGEKINDVSFSWYKVNIV